jgi:hypothetical protein
MDERRVLMEEGREKGDPCHIFESPPAVCRPFLHQDDVWKWDVDGDYNNFTVAYCYDALFIVMLLFYSR